MPGSRCARLTIKEEHWYTLSLGKPAVWERTLRASPPFGRNSCQKHLPCRQESVKAACCHRAQLPCPHIPKTSAGGFATNLPITDRRMEGRSRWKPAFPRRLQSVWHGGKSAGWLSAARVVPALLAQAGKIPGKLQRRLRAVGKHFRLC